MAGTEGMSAPLWMYFTIKKKWRENGEKKNSQDHGEGFKAKSKDDMTLIEI